MNVWTEDSRPNVGDTLSCGHVLEAQGAGTTGYARKRDTSECICYACADDEHRADMQRSGECFAYLDVDGKHITTWSGGKLLTVTREWQTSAGGFAGNVQITRVWARDTAGSMWHGRGPGRGMYVRLKRSVDARGAGR
jgi:hypothetical protein